MKTFEDMTANAIEESTSQMKVLMDHFFLRFIQVLAVVGVLGFIALLIMRRKSNPKQLNS
jgi:hypothetical protein